ncbi:hypothetical protein C8J57DRAFT_1660485 [Mycena rebaudengoi]|nr:hypothetical protein C8J57DRAFT_1660485 [Mycena rebaudengoi]
MSVDDDAVAPAITAVSALTLVTNIYCTVLISWKIWRTTRAAAPADGMNLMQFVAIVVESAALYTAWAIFYTVTHELGSPVQNIVLMGMPPVIGIANALILVRIGLGRNLALPASVTTAPIRFAPRTGTASTESGTVESRRGNESQVVEVKGIAV